MQSKPLNWFSWEEPTDIILPQRLLSSWNGVNPPADPKIACDYDRARAIKGPLGTIPVGNGSGIVISNAPLLTWIPAQDGGYLVVVLTWNEINDELAVRTAEETPLDQFGPPNFTYEVPDPKLFVLGCADTFGNIYGFGHMVIEIAPSRYRISTAERRPTDTESFIVHKFQKV